MCMNCSISVTLLACFFSSWQLVFSVVLWGMKKKKKKRLELSLKDSIGEEGLKVALHHFPQLCCHPFSLGLFPSESPAQEAAVLLNVVSRSHPPFSRWHSLCFQNTEGLWVLKRISCVFLKHFVLFWNLSSTTHLFCPSAYILELTVLSTKQGRYLLGFYVWICICLRIQCICFLPQVCTRKLFYLQFHYWYVPLAWTFLTFTWCPRCLVFW